MQSNRNTNSTRHTTTYRLGGQALLLSLLCHLGGQAHPASLPGEGLEVRVLQEQEVILQDLLSAASICHRVR
eukprot:6249108-Heterocapsa_arctica.AAC.1